MYDHLGIYKRDSSSTLKGDSFKKGLSKIIRYVLKPKEELNKGRSGHLSRVGNTCKTPGMGDSPESMKNTQQKKDKVVETSVSARS